MEYSSQKSIASRCAPAATSTNPQQTAQTRVWSLTQAKSCTLGEESLTLSCIPDRQFDDSGTFIRQVVHPVGSDIQHHPLVAKSLRTYEYRVCVKVEQITGLVYRMVAAPGSPPNSWLRSAAPAMQALTHSWGYVTSDRDAGEYRFYRLNISQPRPANFPDINELADELLADLVIDSLDHPVVQRLLGLTPTIPQVVPPQATSTPSIEEDEEDIYD